MSYINVVCAHYYTHHGEHNIHDMPLMLVINCRYNLMVLDEYSDHVWKKRKSLNWKNFRCKRSFKHSMNDSASESMKITFSSIVCVSLKSGVHSKR